MCFGSPGFGGSLLFFWKHMLVKCPNLWQALHWYFFGWTLESSYMSCISTFGTSVLVVMCALWVKPLLVVGLHLVIFTAILLVVCLFRLHRWLILLIFAWWQLCVMGPDEIDLHSLWVTCYLFYVMYSGFRALQFFGKLAHSACGKLSISTCPSLMVLDTTPHHPRKTRKCPCEGSWQFLEGVFG